MRKLKSSFRDPDGFLFRQNGELLRQVNKSYEADYEMLVSSGLLEKLFNEQLLIHHEERSPSAASDAIKILKPELVPFVSYPYEWSFSQLKDAALLTLKIQKKSLQHGMTLKDASAFNVQFLRGKPIFIDTLSFTILEEGKPWSAYRQFAEHFLAPLALMSYVDLRLNQLQRTNIDGIPLEIAVKLLPRRSRMNIGLFTHLHLHAFFKSNNSQATEKKNTKGAFSKNSFIGLVESLESTVIKLKPNKRRTEWDSYYDETNYSPEAMKAKESFVEEALKKVTGLKSVWDLGANNGYFSRIAARYGYTISFDIDPRCVQENYKQTREEGEENLLPLLLDLRNPSPGLGWNNEERLSLNERGPADVILALALVHHLTIANNLPLGMLAESLSVLCKHLIIEFIPKEDSQVQKLLSTRKDIFSNYTEEVFEEEFSARFEVQEKLNIPSSERVLYLMKVAT
ncbi:SAM-dependent methyltransferase [bacterium J17]|nr:SAM-dependent methyltransferase [bacterium J17]